MNRNAMQWIVAVLMVLALAFRPVANDQQPTQQEICRITADPGSGSGSGGY
jgi:hypothetical protein